VGDKHTYCHTSEQFRVFSLAINDPADIHGFCVFVYPVEQYVVFNGDEAVAEFSQRFVRTKRKQQRMVFELGITGKKLLLEHYSCFWSGKLHDHVLNDFPYIVVSLLCCLQLIRHNGFQAFQAL